MHFEQTIFINVDREPGDEATEKREKAVRKTKRVLLESGAGQEKYVETWYLKGIVWLKGVRMGVWNAENSQMELRGAAEPLRESLDAMLQN